MQLPRFKGHSRTIKTGGKQTANRNRTKTETKTEPKPNQLTPKPKTTDEDDGERKSSHKKIFESTELQEQMLSSALGNIKSSPAQQAAAI